MASRVDPYNAKGSSKGGLLNGGEGGARVALAAIVRAHDNSEAGKSADQHLSCEDALTPVIPDRDSGMKYIARNSLATGIPTEKPGSSFRAASALSVPADSDRPPSLLWDSSTSPAACLSPALHAMSKRTPTSLLQHSSAVHQSRTPEQIMAAAAAAPHLSDRLSVGSVFPCSQPHQISLDATNGLAEDKGQPNSDVFCATPADPSSSRRDASTLLHRLSALSLGSKDVVLVPEPAEAEEDELAQASRVNEEDCRPLPLPLQASDQLSPLQKLLKICGQSVSPML